MTKIPLEKIESICRVIAKIPNKLRLNLTNAVNSAEISEFQFEISLKEAIPSPELSKYMSPINQSLSKNTITTPDNCSISNVIFIIYIIKGTFNEAAL